MQRISTHPATPKEKKNKKKIKRKKCSMHVLDVGFQRNVPLRLPPAAMTTARGCLGWQYAGLVQGCRWDTTLFGRC